MSKSNHVRTLDVLNSLVSMAQLDHNGATIRLSLSEFAEFRRAIEAVKLSRVSEEALLRSVNLILSLDGGSPHAVDRIDLAPKTREQLDSAARMSENVDRVVWIGSSD